MTLTIWLYLQCVLMFVGGQLLQIFFVKLPSVKKRCIAANVKFIGKEYWNEDKYLIIGTFVLGGMCIIGLNEIVQWKPAILQNVKWFFAAVGAFGSTVVLSKFSTFEKKLGNIVDEKTNTADAITGEKNDSINKP